MSEEWFKCFLSKQYKKINEYAAIDNTIAKAIGDIPLIWYIDNSREPISPLRIKPPW